MSENVFRPALQPLDATPRQPLGETLGQHVAQIRPALDGAGDAAAFKRGREAPADGFDFGQFGHGAIRIRSRRK